MLFKVLFFENWSLQDLHKLGLCAFASVAAKVQLIGEQSSRQGAHGKLLVSPYTAAELQSLCFPGLLF